MSSLLRAFGRLRRKPNESSNHKKRLNLSQRLQRRVNNLGTLAFSGIILIICGSAVLLWQQLIREQQDAARHTGDLVDEFLVTLEYDLQSTSDFIGVAGNVNELLRITLGKNRSLLGLYLVSANGEIVSQQHMAGRQDIPEVEKQVWWEQIRQGKTYISAPIYGRQPIPTLWIATPVPDRRGNVRQTLLAEIDLSRIWSQVNRVRVGHTGNAYVVTKEGILLLHPKLTYLRQPTKISALLDLAPDWQRSGGTRLTKHRMAGLSLISTVGINKLDWIVIAELPFADVQS